MAVLGLRFCARAFSSCGEWGPLFIAVHGPLTIATSLVAEHRLQTRRLSSCGSRAQLLHGMWDLPRSGLEPMSPALAGGFSTTAPPGKPCFSFNWSILHQKLPPTPEGTGGRWSWGQHSACQSIWLHLALTVSFGKPILLVQSRVFHISSSQTFSWGRITVIF